MAAFEDRSRPSKDEVVEKAVEVITSLSIVFRDLGLDFAHLLKRALFYELVFQAMYTKSNYLPLQKASRHFPNWEKAVDRAFEEECKDELLEEFE